jgi:Resolvase, N terminal domain
MGHLLGYARVSTTDQQPQLQVDALTAAGCYRVFTETASGARTDRPTLEQVLDQLRPGDTLVVWKLDRLGRSLRHLIDTVTGLAERGVGFRSLQEAIDTRTYRSLNSSSGPAGPARQLAAGRSTAPAAPPRSAAREVAQSALPLGQPSGHHPPHPGITLA